MGYNDPVGDEHRQDQLLPRNRGLSDNYTNLFGDKTSIKHSDFRVSYIHGVKITVLSGPNYEQFVDNYDDLTDLFNIQSGVDKAEFGELQWYKYAYEKSNRLITDERVLPFDETTNMGTWIAPQEMGNGFPDSQFNTPINIDLHFGDTIEFEIVYGGTMGDKFKNFRRYDSSLFNWYTYDFGRANNGQVGPTSTIIELPTTAGMMPSKFAWQARYMFKEALAEEIGPNNKIGVTFRPNDYYNDHDNMNPDKSWSPCCMITPKPVDLSGATATISTQFEELDETSICSFPGDVISAKIDMSLSGLPSKIQGESVEFQATRSPDNVAQSVTTSQSSGRINVSLPAPSAADTINYTFTGQAIVSKGIYKTSYIPPSGSSGARVNNTLLASSQYMIQTGNSNSLRVTSTPEMGEVLVTEPIGNDVTNNLTFWNQIKDLPFPTKNVKNLAPAVKSGPGLIGNLRRPSMIIDASDNQESHYNIKNKDMARFIVMFTQAKNNTLHRSQYFNFDEYVWETYNDSFNDDNLLPGYLSGEPIPIYLPPAAGGTTWNPSGAWKISNLATGSECSESSPRIDIVTVADSPAVPTGITQNITYENGIKVVLEWNDTPNKVIEIDGTGDRADTRRSYQLQRLFKVLLTTDTGPVTFDSDSIMINTNTIEFSDESNSNIASKLVPKDRLGDPLNYYFQIKQVWQATDMYNPDDVKQWESDYVQTETFQVLDCSDPDLTDAETGNTLKNDTLLTCVGLTDYATATQTPPGHESNDQIDLYACRDYGGTITYTYVSGSYNFDEAVADAESRGATLAQFKTPQQLSNFNNYIAGLTNFDGWIGLSDEDTEGVWRWLDGTVAESDCVNWRPGNPNNHANAEHHAHVASYYNNQFNDRRGSGRNGYFYQTGTDQPLETTCEQIDTVQVADVTCQIQSHMEIEFSGIISDQQNVTLTTKATFDSWTTSRDDADTLMYIDVVDDDGGKMYNNQLSVNLTPVTNSVSNAKTVLGYELVPEQDNADSRAPGNRGNIELTKRDNSIVGVVVSDPGGQNILGKPHSSVRNNTQSDRYKFKIYAKVISNG